MSLLTVVQDACGEVGASIPTAVVGTNDTIVQQMFRLAKREGLMLSTGSSVNLSYDWTVLQTEATWTTTATESQGALTTLAPGFRHMIDETIFDRTLQRATPGPLSPALWQWRKAATASGPYSEYRIRGGTLYMVPAPSAGHTAAFEYLSSYWCADASGTAKATYTADDDVARLDENLITLGLIWRFKHAKGLGYAEEFRTYQSAVYVAITNDGGRPRLDMAGQQVSDRLSVPEGSWSP